MNPPGAKANTTGAMALLTDLIGAKTFEDAAQLTLRAVLGAADAALSASAYAETGSVSRVMIHLRPGGAYRHLVVIEAGSAVASTPRDRERRLFSATAWQWLVRQRRAVSIDVNLGLVCLDPEVGGRTVSDRSIVEPTSFATSDSRARLIDRDVTHLLALPLRAASGAVEGMISIEAHCRAAVGLPFIWSESTEALQFLADVAAPYLTTLTAAPAAPPEIDVYLPVIGKDMAATVEILRVFAQQSEPLLIGGPTGAGKSRLARWCHEHSPVRDKPFETLDLFAVPEELQMAELFGWKRGAFTGAVGDNMGLIARARGGTLFINGIGNLSPRAQAGLLHVLEERTYRVLGEDGDEKEADVRFVIGTNQNLQEAVLAKQFREDLYCRINVLAISLPPLDERRDEIPPWADYMLKRRHQTSGNLGSVEISPAGHAALLRGSWPGNLRQLDNIVRRAYAIALTARGSGGDGSFVLNHGHIERAIAYEAPIRSNQAFQSLLAAAAEFVNKARARAEGEPLELDLVDGFKGLVLAVALEKLGGSREEVFRLFGRARLVSSRNHHKAFRREMERAEQLHAVLSKASAFPFSTFLADREEVTETATATAR